MAQLYCLLRRVCIWHSICSIISWYKTESAPYSICLCIQNSPCRDEGKVQWEHAAFPQSVRLTYCEGQKPNYSLAVAQTCQSLQIELNHRGWSLIPSRLLCFESDRIMSTGDLIWTFIGVNLTRITPAPSSHDLQSPPITGPRKTAIIALIQSTSRDYWLWLLAEYSPHDMQFSAPSCSSVAVFLNIHDEVALWFCSWISNWAVKRDTTCP